MYFITKAENLDNSREVISSFSAKQFISGRTPQI